MFFFFTYLFVAFVLLEKGDHSIFFIYTCVHCVERSGQGAKLLRDIFEDDALREACKHSIYGE